MTLLSHESPRSGRRAEKTREAYTAAEAGATENSCPSRRSPVRWA